MYFDGLFGTNLFLQQKIRHICSLVSLKLNNLPEIAILNHGAVATEASLEAGREFFETQLFGQPLNRRQSFPTVSLLNSYVNVVLRCVGARGAVKVAKRIKGFKIFNSTIHNEEFFFCEED